MRRVLDTVESSIKSRLVLRAALLSAACALLLAPARAGQSVPPGSSMLDGAETYTRPEGWRSVIYTLPEDWPLVMYINSKRSGAAELHNTEDSKGAPQARLFLTADPLPEKKTGGEMGGDNPVSHMRKVMEGTVLSNKADSEEWRTVVSTLVQSGKPYLMLEHFGVVDNIYAGVKASI